MTTLKLSCGHEIPAATGAKWVTRPSGDTLCYACLTREDRAYIAHLDVRDFTGRLSADGTTITNGVGGELAVVEDLLDGVYCFVRTGDGRRWRAGGAWTGGFASFKLVEG